MPKLTSVKTTFYRLRALALVLVAGGVVGGAALVHADQFDAQINALQQQNAAAQNVLNGLTSQASSYQGAIDQLQAQINAVQGQIAANQAQQAQVQQQITTDQQQIDQKKQQLSATIKAMYIDGQTSTIEELASSKNLSDYVDKEEYRTNVQDQLNGKIKEIADLQAQLQRQKSDLDTLIASEKTQNDQLGADQAQQNQLLAYNEGQQSAYNQQISANSGQIAELRREQAVLNARYNIGNFKGDPGNGGYPSAWAYAPQDSMIDSWGMYNRECVSYTAFKVHQDYLSGRDSHDMPWWGGSGNANEWPGDARAAGIPVDSNPTPGSIAISTAGFFGHAMYVEAVNGNEIYVQQYNQQLTGQYSEGWRYTTGLVFLHF
ncbi:MAG TPA: CHAP domain-containing protein [Verrucomicrobiae bacterium]|nr:CHAP domain-containing protein [Verrucomicrobiae bacterium]